uniref:Phospholipase D n=2 Tax=Auxenochlorella protothecoides TaxID=3075 RepID=A0A1D2A9Z6_AUXPR
MSCFSASTVQGPTVGFIHGVASFDPLPSAVIIWTRLTLPAGNSGPADVDWVVSRDPEFKSIQSSGTYATGPHRDYTVAIDVTSLEPVTKYYYRFSHGKLSSPTGITKTTTHGPLESMIFGAVSCANWGFGYFHVYNRLAKVDNLDFVVQGGDYIYEYEPGFYPDPPFVGRGGLKPEHRLKTLDDYRERYACYRTDPDLQELHRKVPMIAVWDDHEIADSTWQHGSEDFKGSKEEWGVQKLQALKAYGEWIPVRGFDHDNITLDFAHRSFHFGNLASLVTIENRASARSEPVDVAETSFYKETAQKKLEDWNDDTIKKARVELLEKLRDPKKKMIGEKQVENIRKVVAESIAEDRPWQILLSQTIMSQIKAPLLQETLHLQPKLLRKLSGGALNLAMDEKKAGKEGAEQARMYVGLGKYGVPMNPDAWDGFQAERRKVIEALNQEGANPVIIAGDSHNAWAHNLVDEEGQRLGVEFDGPAVTCIGAFEDIYSRFKAKAGPLLNPFPLYLFTPWIEDSLKAANPDTLQYCNLWQRGFMLFHVTRGKFHTEYHFVSNVKKQKKFRHYCEATFEVHRNEKGNMHPAVRYLTFEGVIPKRAVQRASFFVQYTHDISLAMHKST